MLALQQMFSEVASVDVGPTAGVGADNTLERTLRLVTFDEFQVTRVLTAARLVLAAKSHTIQVVLHVAEEGAQIAVEQRLSVFGADRVMHEPSGDTCGAKGMFTRRLHGVLQHIATDAAQEAFVHGAFEAVDVESHVCC